VLFCVLFVLYIIVVPLSPGENPFAVKINNNNNNIRYNTSRNIDITGHTHPYAAQQTSRADLARLQPTTNRESFKTSERGVDFSGHCPSGRPYAESRNCNSDGFQGNYN
jgi:hypothetical protein